MALYSAAPACKSIVNPSTPTLDQLTLDLNKAQTHLNDFVQDEAHKFIINFLEQTHATINLAQIELKKLYATPPFSHLKFLRLQNSLRGDGPAETFQDKEDLKQVKEYNQKELAQSSKKLTAQVELNSISPQACDVLLQYYVAVHKVLNLETQIFKLKYKNLVSIEQYFQTSEKANLMVNYKEYWKELELLNTHKGNFLQEFDTCSKAKPGSGEYQNRYLLCSIALERDYIKNRIFHLERNFWEQQYSNALISDPTSKRQKMSP